MSPAAGRGHAIAATRSGLVEVARTGPAEPRIVGAKNRRVFCALHTNLHGHDLGAVVAPRQEIIRIRGQEAIPIQMWVLTPQL
ncbi:hypothetical protein ACIRPT_21350 [Streptomyces sp. NPDC101227]|uniref:hypothetical protein n=1 Tax=Streptomyces sp. NPDC101227 TaxID=3366136 RepID=UPI0038014C41